MKEIVITPKNCYRLDKYLCRYLDLAPAGFIYRMLRKKNITVNGGKAKPSYKLKPGDHIEIYLSDETIKKFKKEITDKDIWQNIKPIDKDRIIYEDENYIIALKKVGELSQKSNKKDISINEKILAYLYRKNEWDAGDGFTPGIANRLDRNTEGLIIFSKTLYGAKLISELIKNREVRKFYIALAEGVFPDEGTTVLDAYLIKDEKTNTVKIIKDPDINDKDINKKPVSIKTSYRKIKELPEGTLVEIELITGKSHQIRAHMASVSHPLVGDKKYGGSGRRGYFLRAYKLVFPKDERLNGLCGKTIEISENLKK